ncbi:MAG: spore maturation protein [Ruminococcus sp.]|nr:spore maturation protein [Ruminococcus sp.]
MNELLVPLIFTLILVICVFKKINITDTFAEGAFKNLKLAFSLLPMLILMMTAIGVFTASGIADAAAELISPLTETVGFPKECVKLALIRPFSGSGALAAVEDIFSRVHPDSVIGLITSVLMASTETTIYTISVYYSALQKKPGCRVFIAAAAADLTGFILASLTVRLMLS